jgi:hypothetical protein
MSQILSSIRFDFPTNQRIQKSVSVYQDGYQKTEFILGAGNSDKRIDLAPIDNADDLGLLFIMSSLYPLSGSTPQITYKLHSSGNSAIDLDCAQLFCGEGQLSTLSAIPDVMYFSNAFDSDVTITILLARNVESSFSSNSSNSSNSSESSAVSSSMSSESSISSDSLSSVSSESSTSSESSISI